MGITMAMPNRESFDEEAPVIEAIRSGDRFAFAELLKRHDGWVRGVIYGVLGDRDCLDDVAQQAWTAFWLRITELRDARKWRPWLYRLTRNAAIDAGRDVTRRRGRSGSLPQDAAATDPAAAPEKSMVRDERQRDVLAAVQALPALYREPFVLRHLNGWSYRDISEAMGMPVDTVETRLVRARRFLRESLKDKVL